MKKATIISVLSLMAAPVWAQPPEEVPPPPPDTGVVNEIVPAPPAPSYAPPVASMPVAEPKGVPAPTVPEDNRVKGMTLAPSIGVYPFGYDNIDVTGEDEGKKYYFGIKPGISLDTAMKTSSDKTMNFSAGYQFAWREYYNKTTTDRDFTNSFSASFGMKVNELLSLSIPGSFDWFFKSGADTSGDNSVVINLSPSMGFSANSQLSFNVGYDYMFLDLIDAEVGPGGIDLQNPPDDIDDITRGGYLSSSTAFDSFDPNNFGLVDNNFTSGVATESLFWSDHTMILGTAYKFATTKLDLTYKFLFARVSNMDAQDLAAHFITPGVSQTLPWNGGSVSLKNEFRFRNYKYATVAGTDVARQQMRSSLRLSLNQPINSSFTFEGIMRMDLIGENKDDYANLDDSFAMYMGIVYSF